MDYLDLKRNSSYIFTIKNNSDSIKKYSLFDPFQEGIENNKIPYLNFLENLYAQPFICEYVEILFSGSTELVETPFIEPTEIREDMIFNSRGNFYYSEQIFKVDISTRISITVPANSTATIYLIEKITWKNHYVVHEDNNTFDLGWIHHKQNIQFESLPKIVKEYLTSNGFIEENDLNKYLIISLKDVLNFEKLASAPSAVKLELALWINANRYREGQELLASEDGIDWEPVKYRFFADRKHWVHFDDDTNSSWSFKYLKEPNYESIQ